MNIIIMSDSVLTGILKNTCNLSSTRSGDISDRAALPD